jgi:hypothetical protein
MNNGYHLAAEEDKMNHGRMLLWPAIVIQEYFELVGICVELYVAPK